MKSIMSLEKMGYYTYQLLEGAKIDFFKDDPTDIYKNIERG